MLTLAGKMHKSLVIKTNSFTLSLWTGACTKPKTTNEMKTQILWLQRGTGLRVACWLGWFGDCRPCCCGYSLAVKANRIKCQMHCRLYFIYYRFLGHRVNAVRHMHVFICKHEKMSLLAEAEGRRQPAGATRQPAGATLDATTKSHKWRRQRHQSEMLTMTLL